ncbi:SDR family oxidoreductase [Actinocrispum wychmicini]|uniref:NAD(P)-dependent dehydrogenase (Short-subunit alcohol dehydrogenase family) n=1 Tax=Actinocrispum wychmicini TaxID=1213861 RepID=A0A4V2S5R0_9PSEU|nr:SDR family oxidoreductase [Actinocrispum wychmicini]TCO53100.1 NAD(P)-dependent dehydrogenase (short-subunit alcohol dehydrogenase family) [Actinocrispum wychmicini]
MSETVALVTGANKGLGYETVKQLRDLGMTVLLAARDPERGTEAAKSLGVDFVRLDVTDPASAQAAAAVVGERFGRLDVLVNNAGITGGESGLIRNADLATIRAVFDTNYFGIIHVTQAMLPLLLKSTAPRIVNVSSGVGSLAKMSDPDSPMAAMPGGLAYVPTKTAVNSLTVQYTRELRKDGVLVNAADPGYCATDLNNHSGFRTAAQGAAVSVHLATLPPDGPTGGFFTDDGAVVPW